MISRKQSRIPGFNRVRSVVIIGVTVIGLLLTGCAEVNHLRDAQSAFSEAARVENELRTSGSTTTEANELILESEVRAKYASAIASIDSLTNKQISSLKSDKLWGVALTIKAMSYWRLGGYDEMDNVANLAAGLKDDEIYPRDKALLLALPGLRRVDEAQAIVAASIKGKNQEHNEAIKKERLKAVERLVGNAATILNQARQSVSEEHSVRSYLIQAELAGYKNLQDGRNKFTGGSLNSAEKKEVEQLLIELDCSYKKSLEDSYDLLLVRAKVILAWQERFGLLNKDVLCKE